MALISGQTAPDFSVTDIDGVTIRLADYAGKKLLICFFRYAGCPFCNILLNSLAERYPKLQEQGLEILAFIQSPGETVLGHTAKGQIPRTPFPLIADPEREVYDLYDVGTSLPKIARSIFIAPKLLTTMYKHRVIEGKIDGDMFLIPAFFLIGPDNLRIHEAYYSPDFSTMIPDVDIVDFAMS